MSRFEKVPNFVSVAADLAKIILAELNKLWTSLYLEPKKFQKCWGSNIPAIFLKEGTSQFYTVYNVD